VSLVLANVRVVDARGERAGDVAVEGARIAAAPAPGAERVDLGGSVLAPGFLDLHVHGGGGASFHSPDPAAARAAAAFHLAHGTTGLLATTLVAAPAPLRAIVAALAEAAAEEPGILGIHLEGPYMNPARPGALSAGDMRAPDPEEAEALRAAGPVRMISLAPELPGAEALTRRLTAEGVVVAMGHSDATYVQARAVIDAGARHAIHLFNAARPLHHREPGILGAVLEDPGVSCEVIADGHHLHPATIRVAVAAKGAARVALVTDAMEAAGMPPGRYRLADADVDVAEGRATLAGSDTLAGSVLTMERAVAGAVAFGVPLPDAIGMATAVPARVLGLEARKGLVEPGLDADLVVLDPEALTVRGVLRGGIWVRRP
jgi:N-acetylglucosamine-6-phosphate deacetylase